MDTQYCCCWRFCHGTPVTLFELFVVLRVHFYFAANKTHFVFLLYAREMGNCWFRLFRHSPLCVHSLRLARTRIHLPHTQIHTSMSLNGTMAQMHNMLFYAVRCLWIATQTHSQNHTNVNEWQQRRILQRARTHTKCRFWQWARSHAKLYHRIMAVCRIFAAI